ncbi:hypothetical protein AGABI2DRAFT_194873 [Agaricus bisporus var. bisporus H97]|uniref:hypothetical protein n=1 Tax=Agaricus bisporus var. bisporus (strain H97 / ATCC MYA-4626 / FGSC 10389) TaxID=936046 RepID=UPI00029F718C|nr:hypothetical protein AGABI2DRAFT_194873 [Agaricus bisporus var. bisporus H97]EKV43966.1 hypothetical protein AGABI2DRAFT_194873 [Agaricus bisporus var. bisporus H97]
MSSSGKIIIRPRVPKRSNAASARRAASEADSEALASVKEEFETENDQMDADDEDDNSHDGSNQPMDFDDRVDERNTEEGAPPTPARRGRGRPKGSTGIQAKSSGTSTPRGRPKGTARAKGKGKAAGVGPGLTIRLKAPKGEDEDDSADEDAAEVEAPTPAAAELEEEAPAKEPPTKDPPPKEPPAKEAPMGGGKPFRKIADKVYIIDGDEFVTDDDPKGDEKIDKWGNLLGGRKFKASTFILPNRHPQRQYMLAIDAARTSGFRDSLYYFRRNPLAFKLNGTQPEKDYLISEGKLGSHLRTRSVTLVTARSVFKLHGSKTIIDGKWVTDDYYEEKVLAEITAKGLKAGDPVGELPDPNAPAHPPPDANLANSTFASSSNVNVAGGGGIYRAGGPTTIFGGSGWGPFSDGPLNAVRKSLLSRDGVTEENWMWMMAGRANEADEEWARLRKEGRGKAGLTVGGVVMGGKGSAWLRPDPIPKDTTEKKPLLGEQDNSNTAGADTTAMKVKAGTKRKAAEISALGVYEPHTNMILYHSATQPTRATWQLLPNSKPRVLGGTRSGNGAWGMAWVDTVMQLPDEDEETRTEKEKEKQERERYVREAEEMFGQGASSTTGGRNVSTTLRDVSVLSTPREGMNLSM